MVSVLLDTHVLIWWLTDRKRLSRAQARTLEHMEEAALPVAVSAITLWEAAKLVQLGRWVIPVRVNAWLDEIEAHPLVAVLPLTGKIAAESILLGDNFPKDPADQIIAATARCHGLRLMTADDRIRRWGKVSVI